MASIAGLSCEFVSVRKRCASGPFLAVAVHGAAPLRAHISSACPYRLTLRAISGAVPLPFCVAPPHAPRSPRDGQTCLLRAGPEKLFDGSAPAAIPLVPHAPDESFLDLGPFDDACALDLQAAFRRLADYHEIRLCRRRWMPLTITGRLR